MIWTTKTKKMEIYIHTAQYNLQTVEKHFENELEIQKLGATRILRYTFFEMERTEKSRSSNQS